MNKLIKTLKSQSFPKTLSEKIRIQINNNPEKKLFLQLLDLFLIN